LLAAIGVRVTTHATWVLAHGGNKAFGGAFDYPGWSLVHFLPALVFIVILPFQLWSGLRGRYPAVHRVTGRIAAACALALSATGLALPLVMPARPFGERAYMTTVSVLFVLLIWRGIAAARRRDLATHRRWMLRVAGPRSAHPTRDLPLRRGRHRQHDALRDLFTILCIDRDLVLVEWWIRRR
jgi:uncharacterized membrane protein